MVEQNAIIASAKGFREETFTAVASSSWSGESFSKNIMAKLKSD